MKTEIFSFVENVGSSLHLLQILETSGGGDRGRAPENIPGASALGGGSHPPLCLPDPPLPTSPPCPPHTHTVLRLLHVGATCALQPSQRGFHLPLAPRTGGGPHRPCRDPCTPAPCPGLCQSHSPLAFAPRAQDALERQSS